LQGLKTYCIS